MTLSKSSSSARGRVVWLTGLSGSGKSTLAAALLERLIASGQNKVFHLDGDCHQKICGALPM